MNDESMHKRRVNTVAYFSMEIALNPGMSTYSGGLGILAGDTVRSAADSKLSMIAVTLLHRKGYFRQRLDSSGWQSEEAIEWDIQKYCTELQPHVQVGIEDRTLQVRAWQYNVTGVGGHVVSVLMLDTDLPENSEWDRALTHHLYGGDLHHRLCQEIVLGIGGVRMLRALGHSDVRRFHMNEGHAALLGLELLDERARWFNRAAFNEEDVQAIRSQCVFTTHTPVPAGHDKFPIAHAARVLGRTDVYTMKDVFCSGDELNTTYMALNLSHYVNGVAQKHGEVSRAMLTPHDDSHEYTIDSITNGVHLGTWAAPSFEALFDRYIPRWRHDNASVRNAICIPTEEIWQAHMSAKGRLIDDVNRRTQANFDSSMFTLGFARRMTAYKRADLLLKDPARLKAIAGRFGGMQIIFGGKAHPLDSTGKQLIQDIIRSTELLRPEVRLVFLENYDWDLARLLTAGVDVWLNTPLPPMEASGTSGMKAALNGVPSLSVLDGWWVEGCVEGVTGWAIVDTPAGSDPAEDSRRDASNLYDKLEQVVLPHFHEQHDAFIRVMRHAIALNASHFNTQRMVQEYGVKAYLE